MHILKRTKILAGVGPATNSKEKIEQMLHAGVNGYRMNFSHGTYEEREQQLRWIREASVAHGRPVAVVQDLQGPKVRLGNLNDNHQDVVADDILILDSAAEHDGLVLPMQYNLAEKVKVGERIYLFDGKIRTKVIEIASPTAVKVRAENGGVLMSRKGVNLPDTDFGGDIITPKDVQDIEYAADKDYDYVALSFIQSADDIHALRQMLVSLGSEAHVIAKIETRAAIQDGVLEAIVRASDGVMVARGDLAPEVGLEMVPIIQRKVVSLCRKHGKLSIIATQMMSSMVDNPEPTRAEVSDVATAVIQGADAVMLSDETANGNYPIETIEAMRNTILYTQEHCRVEILDDEFTNSKMRVRHAISHAAVEVAEEISATAIIAETKSGATAANIGAWRPNLPIISVTSSTRAAQQLALSFANRSFIREDDDEAGYKLAQELARNNFFQVEVPITVVIVSGRQPGKIGATDTIKVRIIE
ncbi:pyruvate kinase [Candidatus Saccharibacteria bacterium]|nr:MAG: pyruvate kinase [Candidatus Saccharibacteria bacterium]